MTPALPAPFGGRQTLARYGSARQALLELCLLRSLLLTCLLMAACWAWRVSPGPFQLSAPLIILFSVLVLVNVLTGLRLRHPRPVAHDEIFLQLLFDLLLLTLLFRHSGGGNNPFVTYLLVPLAIAASLLPWKQTLALLVLVLAAYGSLFGGESPTPTTSWPWASYHGHLAGMAINFLLSAALMVFFLARMQRVLRAQDRHLAEQQRRQHQRDQAVALGTLAAGAVHDLATPLASMTLLADELADALSACEWSAGTDRPSAMALNQALREQLQRSRDILAVLREQARHPEALPPRALAEQLGHCLQGAQALRAGIVLQWQPGPDDTVPIRLPWRLQQVIHNGLKNALEAASQSVTVTARRDGGLLQLTIVDDGPGFTPAQLQHEPQPQASDKPDGLGLGLFLSAMTLAELGGSLQCRNRVEGGACLRIHVPWGTVDPLSPAASESPS